MPIKKSKVVVKKKKVSITRPIIEVKKKKAFTLLNKESKSKVKVKVSKEPKELELYKSKELTLPEEMKPLKELSDKVPQIIKLLNWFETQRETEAVVSKLELNEKELKGELKAANFKIYLKILNKFDKLAEKYPSLKKQDLISQALLEFIEKYL